MFKYAFLASLAVALLAGPVAPVVSPAYAEATSAKTPTPAQATANERRKKCGAEWKEAKAAGKVEKGMKWPKFYSACNKRLKGI